MTPWDDTGNEHERFRELAALATAGALSEKESAELEHHLETCRDCRVVSSEYRELVEHGLPLLALVPDQVKVAEDWDPMAARAKLLERVRAAERARGAWLVRARAILPPALAACLVIGIGFSAYQLGSRGKEEVRPAGTAAGREALLAEAAALQDSLRTGAEKLATLQRATAQREQEIRELRMELRLLERRSSEAVAAREASAEHLRESFEARERLSRELAAVKTASEEQIREHARGQEELRARLRELEQANRSAQAELTLLRSERERASLRVAALERREATLSAANRAQQRRITEQEQYLASDRDIRELMGARQLYIADVFDVSSDSRTRKPFGRVFYTKGKSLVFYAFDLDRQGRVRDAAFQAWGRNESFQEKPVSLGILYLDSEANRRWALRIDDAAQLAQLDAVFVTVEPHGGSRRPTGKPLLYASLRREPNHQ